MKEQIRMQRQRAIDRLVQQAERDQRKARTMACTGVRLFAEGEVKAGDVLEDIDELRRATVRVELLRSMTVLDLEGDES